MKADVA